MKKNNHLDITRSSLNPYDGEFRLFVVFLSFPEFFTCMKTSPLPVKGYKFWPIFGTHGHGAVNWGSLACHTYCDTGRPFKGISTEPCHSHQLSIVWQRNWGYLDNALDLSNTRPSACEANADIMRFVSRVTL